MHTCSDVTVLARPSPRQEGVRSLKAKQCRRQVFHNVLASNVSPTPLYL